MGTVIVSSVPAYGPRVGRPAALSIGNFDGVHRGHLRLAGRLVEEARRRDLAAVVLTFEPHTSRFLAPARFPGRLSSPALKQRLLARAGLDAVVVQPFDAAFAAIPAREFVERVLARELSARLVVAGPGLRFGAGGEGDANLLEKCGNELGIGIVSEPSFGWEGSVASSSNVRRLLLEEGDVARAAALLGRPYGIEGRVERGAGRGSALGFPTANLSGMDVIVPREGVYAAAGRVGAGGEILPAAVHVGERKTFGEPWAVEAHLVGLPGGGPLYGRSVQVFFLQRLRGVERFDGGAQLAAAMGDDVARTIALFAQSMKEVDPSLLEC